ncbi:MAG: hypothetical protein NZ108_07785, partial [Bacteroidia bacterium]|nr:hypothetical protein [Bacteroidia bacterium]
MICDKISFFSSSIARQFIEANLNQDVHWLALHTPPFPNKSELLQQIELLQKSVKKLPTWYEARTVLEPTLLQMASSEWTAYEKSKVLFGKIADL